MLVIGIEYDEVWHTCLMVLKDMIPEIRSSDMMGDSRWEEVERLDIVSNGDIIRDGDLVVWGEGGIWEFRPKHIGLIVNYERSLVYHVQYGGSMVEENLGMRRGYDYESFPYWPLRYYRIGRSYVY